MLRSLVIATTLLNCASQAQDIQLISIPQTAPATAAGPSMAPVISADGSRIAFLSSANNLVTNDDTGVFLDLFLCDLDSQDIRLASKSRFGPGGGNGNSAFPSISSNGQSIAYSSEAENLVPGTTNFISDIFIYDTAIGTNRLLSVNALGQMAQGGSNGPPIKGSARPVISPDGRWITFESTAWNLPIQTNNFNESLDLFLRDTTTNTLLHVNGTNTSPGINTSFAAALTLDGRRAAYLARYPRSGPLYNTTTVEVFVRDFVDNATFSCAARLTNYFRTTPYAFLCLNPIISADGKVVAFKGKDFSTQTNVILFRYEITTDTLTAIDTNTLPENPAALSGDGRFVAYEAFGRFWPDSQVLVWDALTAARQFVSLSYDGTAPAEGASTRPTMTPDGRFIAFLSTATNVLAGSNPQTQWQLYLRDMQNGLTRLVSFNTNRQPGSAGVHETVPSLSADGTKLVFDYAGSDLVPADFNEAPDVFLYDWPQDQITLISRAHPARPAATTPLGITAEPQSVSADGRYVAHTRYACGTREAVVFDSSIRHVTSLSTGTVQPLLSANGHYAVFLQQQQTLLPQYAVAETNRIFRADLLTGTTERVDPDPIFRTSSLLTPRPFGLAISTDGRLILYEKTNRLYLKDLETGSYAFVSPGVGASWYPLLSPDNRWVAYQYSGSDLGANAYNILARDLHSQQTVIVSLGLSGRSTPKSFSSCSRYLVYENDQSSSIHLFDFLTRSNHLVCNFCSKPQVTGTGPHVSYIFGGFPSPPSVPNLFLKHIPTGTEMLMTVNTNYYDGWPGSPYGDARASDALISADSRFLVFTSLASNLVAGDRNARPDVFVRDRFAGKTTLLSANAANGSGRPALSQDGRTVVFQSSASNLSSGDYNNAADMFLVRLAWDDSDNDGMSDPWEQSLFSTLDRNGSGDHDHDNRTDLDEYIAGTSPTNALSMLGVTTFRVHSNDVVIACSSIRGKRYVVQFTEDLNRGSWRRISPVLTPYDPVLWTIRGAGTTSRGFYRVMLVQ